MTSDLRLLRSLDSTERWLVRVPAMHHNNSSSGGSERGISWVRRAVHARFPGPSRAHPQPVKISAGLLLFRRGAAGLELFLAHPGGPFWTHKDAGAWTIPKGVIEPGEDPLAAARREFEEETGVTPTGPFLPLGSIRQKAGKEIHAWAWEGDADPDRVTSNLVQTEWPRGSGRRLTFPEVDRCGWFGPATARKKLNPAQAELISRLEAALG
jgi:predicted NUDIX family NTP pyrophosphohydrolase